MYLGACSNQKLESLGVVKKKANQYSVTKKAPLEMPPDMLLRPPKAEDKKEIYSSSFEQDQASLDDILNNKEIPKVKKRNNNKKSLLKQDRLLKKILNTKAIITLK